MRKIKCQKESDFWWLPEDAASKTLSVGLGHHRQIRDDEDPSSLLWCRPLEVGKEPSNNLCVYPLDYLDKWRDACNNTNVYRTLKVFEKDIKEAAFLGPFLVDIDNGEEDLVDALDVTRKAVDILVTSCKLNTKNLRIFFSGRKGFNIEVRPQSLKIVGCVADQIALARARLVDIIGALRGSSSITSSDNMVSTNGTVIDLIYGGRHDGYELKHPYIRLHNSINRWIANDGKEVNRMKFELSLRELNSLGVEEILRKSERLALNYLSSEK